MEFHHHHLHSSTPPHALSKIPPKTPTRIARVLSPALRTPVSATAQKKQISSAAAAEGTTTTSSVSFKTLGGCKLGISRYPDFEYNALGGSGTGKGIKNKSVADDDYEISVNFNVATLYIPPLVGATTKFLGLPLPPFLKIDIAPEILKGIINHKTGEVNLLFRAQFWFSIGSIYRAPPLLVETVLTSEESEGQLRTGKGERLNDQGNCRLVGVATVARIDDFLMDSFLSLPTECLANLNATISFSTSTSS